MYTPLNSTFIYSETGVYRGLPISLTVDPKQKNVDTPRGGTNMFPQSMFLTKILKISKFLN